MSATNRQPPAMDGEQQGTELAEELHRVLFAVFLVLGRRDHCGALPGDLTLAQLSILVALQECGPMRMTMLADHLRVRTPTATVAVRRLVKLGFIARSRDSTDLRAVVVRMTSQGQAVCSDALARRHLQFAAMLATLSPSEHAILNRVIPPLDALACLGNG